MSEYSSVNQEVVDIAKEMIEKHHKSLENARIAFLFRAEAQMKNGRAVLGTASLVGAKWRPLLKDKYDFLIILAADFWLDILDNRQKRALIDHELCHCIFTMPEGKASIRNHDVEEFYEVIQRHGDWLGQIEGFEAALHGEEFQDFLIPFGADERSGGVFAPELGNEVENAVNEFKRMEREDGTKVTVSRG